jgi:hypothetical protein
MPDERPAARALVVSPEGARWLLVASAAAEVLGLDRDAETEILRRLHDVVFIDIDAPTDPPVGGTVADAGIATKMLLWSLLTNRVDPEFARKGYEFAAAYANRKLSS